MRLNIRQGSLVCFVNEVKHLKVVEQILKSLQEIQLCDINFNKVSIKLSSTTPKIFLSQRVLRYMIIRL